MKNKILVTGCGRSGTMFTSKALIECDLKVKHERIEKDGAVTWAYFNSERIPHFFRIKEIDWNDYHKFLQIRDPQQACCSMQTAGTESWNYIESVFSEIKTIKDRKEKIVTYWILWNYNISKSADYCYDLKNGYEYLKKMCEIMKKNPIDEKRYQELTTEKINTRKYKEFDHTKYIPANLKNEYEHVINIMEAS